MTKQFNLNTKRTFLRELKEGDAEDFYNLNLDREVLKYTGDKPFNSVEDAKNFLLNYDQYKLYGVGRLAVIDKKSQKFIGWCGLKYSPDIDEYDIGFRFFKEYWNKGFATETARKCLEFGLYDLGIVMIVGRAMKDNKSSIKVLEKLGMTFMKTFDFEGQEGVIYSITKNDFLGETRNTKDK